MDRLLDRFCRYAKIETTSAEDSETYPSTETQLDLCRLLKDECAKIGLADVHMSKHGIVTATIPATNRKSGPVIAWIAHVDTSPEAPGKGVKPTIHKKYNGKDIVLPGDKSKVIKIAENEGLADLKGKTIITSDGKTLLGADDKAGVAIIMETAERLMEDKKIKHSPVRVCFTCDEEVGHGVDHVNLKQLGATVAYTLDGEAQGKIETETFSADLATVTVTGINTHPAHGKGKMVNAVRILGDFISRMPRQWLSPETTDQRDGFMHPYIIEGGVPEAKVKILLRDFITAKLGEEAQILEQIAGALRAEHPRAKIAVDIKKQYRNMGDGLAKEPRSVSKAQEALRALGIEPSMEIIRGGTDGSRLTEMGLPTPNLSAGMHAFHSPLEWACLEEMETGVKVLTQLAQLWGKEK
ncbi:MAG TPA: peptidase T [Phycisphaerae bacterium]|nr:peptidase T [Phycisphaerae bacterium]